MKRNFIKFIRMLMLSVVISACSALSPATEKSHVDVEEVHAEEPSTMQSDNGFSDRDALPNDSGLEDVQTFPDKSIYHDHIKSVEEPVSDVPPAFGAHLSAWQNCGIYDQPVGLGNALHSLEHGAVWLTYAPDLSADEVEELRNLVRGRDFVLMSPYSQQTKPVVLTAWTVQLVIESLPDNRIADFIEYYENGPQNPEPGAPCSGGIGTPIN